MPLTTPAGQEGRAPKGGTNTCLILTESFPYPGGDDYLVHEIKAWAATGLNIVVAPSRIGGTPFTLPAEVAVDLSLADLRSARAEPFYAMRGATSKLFWRDIARLARNRRLSPAAIVSCLRSVARTLRSKQGLKVIVRDRGRIFLAYSYWNDTESFAAALCKMDGTVGHVVSRAHGFDLYAERRPGKLLPLKDQLIEAFDGIFTVSEQGRKYLMQRHSIPIGRLHVSRLGIQVPDFACPPSPPGCFTLVSLAYCVELKRIDKLIAGLADAAARNPNIEYSWHHIGDGPLLSRLREDAQVTLSQLPNVRFQFEGRLDNEDVFDFFRAHCVDVIVNTSDTEGAPVSLMEAMGCSIPAIAPDVGGIGEIVGQGLGYLMRFKPSVADVTAAIEASSEFAKDPEVRAAVRASIQSTYNASDNYPAFVGQCLAVTSWVSTNGPSEPPSQ
jgi:colanic acid/amylovoran biosynthesis glycosyltransferase